MPYGYPRRLIIGSGADARAYRVAGDGVRTPRWKSEPVPAQEGDPMRERRVPLGDGSTGLIGSHRHLGRPTKTGVADVTNGDTSVEDRYGAGPLITSINLATGDFYSAGTIGSSLTIGGEPAGAFDHAWTVIDTATLGGPASSVSFTGISSTYRMFRVTAYIVKDGTGGEVEYRINNDSGTNYDRQRLRGTGATVDAERLTGQTSIASAIGIGANQASTIVMTVGKQLASSSAMLLISQSLTTTASNFQSVYMSGRWNNTADLISRIDLISSSGNFAAGTTVVLEAM